MERYDVGARLHEAFDVLFGFHDHQMHVEAFRRGPADGFHYRETERDVGHEYAVHHVDMHPLGGTAVDHAGVALQMAEVGREHRRREYALHSNSVYFCAKIQISEGKSKPACILPGGSI